MKLCQQAFSIQVYLVKEKGHQKKSTFRVGMIEQQEPDAGKVQHLLRGMSAGHSDGGE